MAMGVVQYYVLFALPVLVSWSHLGQQRCSALSTPSRVKISRRGLQVTSVTTTTTISTSGSLTPPRQIPTFGRISTLRRSSSSNNDGQNDDDDTNKKPKKKGGYKFGDLTKSFVTKVTNKPDYEFGDLSRYLDRQAKSSISSITQKDDYEFGDLSRYIDSRVKDSVASFANKENYEFGDLSREIVRRVAKGDVTWGDMVTLLKVLLSFGVGFAPISPFLPVKFLIDLLNYSIAADVGDRFVGAVTMEVDKRMKEAFTGDPEYRAGDLTKKAVLKYIGKEEYSFGDVTKKVMEDLEEEDGVDGKKGGTFLGEMDEGTKREMEAWDSKILIKAQEDMKR